MPSGGHVRSASGIVGIIIQPGRVGLLPVDAGRSCRFSDVGSDRRSRLSPTWPRRYVAAWPVRLAAGAPGVVFIQTASDFAIGLLGRSFMGHMINSPAAAADCRRPGARRCEYEKPLRRDPTGGATRGPPRQVAIGCRRNNGRFSPAPDRPGRRLRLHLLRRHTA